MTSAELAEAFGALLQRHTQAQLMWVAPDWWLAEEQELAEWPTEHIRVLWDLYDGINSPLGFSGEVLHAVLNGRGDGAYCAI